MSDFRKILEEKNITVRELFDHVRSKTDRVHYKPAIYFHLSGDRVPTPEFYKTFYQDLLGMTMDEFYARVLPKERRASA